MSEMAFQVDMGPFRAALVEVFGTDGKEHTVVWESVGSGNRWGRLDGKPITVLTGDDPDDYKRKLQEYKASLERARAGGKTGGAVS